MLKIKLKKKIDKSYQIRIVDKLENELKKFLKETCPKSNICILSDTKTAKLFGQKLLKKLPNAKLVTFPSGEKSKSLNQVEKICTKMVEDDLKRKDILIALGGGVTGDLGGFVAAVYMRGIPYIQIPTSLLAMVDSSIGGKTGVDLEVGKNLVGAFHQPLATFINLEYLETLPKREFNNGMAEIIKHGIIKDKSYFKWIEKNAEKIKSLDKKILRKMILKSCDIKKKVVENDEHEKGLRMILNYGHTIGHALEQLSHYKLRHGEAISIGMVKENKLSQLKEKDLERIKKLFETFNLPTDHKLCHKKKELIEIMQNDKKAVGNKPKFALPIRIGKTVIKEFSPREITKVLK